MFAFDGEDASSTTRARSNNNLSIERPRGVTLIAVVFFAAAVYLVGLGVVRLANPDLVSLSLGAPLLHGLELAGAYAFLLAGAAAALIGFGLLRLNNLARRAAIVVCAAGIFMLIPKVSAAASDISVDFFFAGSMIVLRVMIVWYLWQRWTAEKFK
jgi:hypothetical protein